MELRNNKGFTLVEVLIAFAVSAIVLTSITSLIFSSLKLYGSNNANIEVQNESQAVLNLLVDNIMQAQGICMRVPTSGTNTECLLLGDIRIKENGSGNYTATFKGTALVSDIDTGASGSKELYLADFPNDKYTDDGLGYCELVTDADTVEEAAEKSMDLAQEYVLEYLNETDRIQWLLGSYVTACTVVPPIIRHDEFRKETKTYVGFPDPEINYYFTEPFTVRVSLSFSYDYDGKSATRTLEDEVSVRGRLREIYADMGDVDGDGSDDGMQKFIRY